MTKEEIFGNYYREHNDTEKAIYEAMEHYKEQELTAEREKAAKLVEAATAVMKSWSNGMRGEIEEERENQFGNYKYWSPAASLVGSKDINKLRQAITEYKKQ